MKTWIYLQINMWSMLLFAYYIVNTTELNEILAYAPWFISVFLVIGQWFDLQGNKEQ